MLQDHVESNPHRKGIFYINMGREENGNGYQNGGRNGSMLALRAHARHLDSETIRLMHSAGAYGSAPESSPELGVAEVIGIINDNLSQPEPSPLIIEDNTFDHWKFPNGVVDAGMVDEKASTPLINQPTTETKIELAQETGAPVIELSMYEPGSRSFVKLVDRMFGLSESGLLTQDELHEAINPKREEEKLEDAERKPGHEVILYRKAERERLAKMYPAAILDENFYKFIEEAYGITGDVAKERFYEGTMNLTNEVYDGWRQEILPFSKGRLGLRNEIDPPQHFPSRLFYLLISPNTHPDLRYEAQRSFTTFPIGAELISQMWNYRLRGKLNDIMAVLDEQMFEGMTGEAHSQPINAWHDEGTGRVNRIDGPDSKKKPPQNARFKQHGILMRNILDMDEMAWIDLDEKNLATAIRKSLIKAADPEEAKEKNRPLGVVAPLDDATDLARLVFAVNGGSEEVLRVMNRFREIIEDPENYEFLSEVESIKEDHKTNGREGQSAHIKFKRLQLKFEDLPIPVEVQFYDIQRYLNSQLAIGRKKKDGQYDGGAHDLYNRYRLWGMFRTVFPESIYPNPEDKTYEEMAMEYTDQLAVDLLERVLEGKAA